MRQNLKKLNPKTRYQFTGTFSAVGFKNSYGHYMPTYLLTDVKYDGQIMTDHLWFNYGKQLSDLGMLKIGDQLTFTGSIKPYYKGYYLNQTKDYKIFNPRQVHLVETDFETFRPKMPNPLTDKNALIGYIMTVNKAFYLSTGRPYETWYVDQYRNWRKNYLKQIHKPN